MHRFSIDYKIVNFAFENSSASAFGSRLLILKCLWSFISFALMQKKRNKEKIKEKQCFHAQGLRTPAVFPGQRPVAPGYKRTCIISIIQLIANLETIPRHFLLLTPALRGWVDQDDVEVYL